MIRRLGRISALAYPLLLSQAGALMIAEDGRPASVIVVESLATPVEKHAAEELAEFLWRVSGARLEIAAERRPGARWARPPGAHARQDGGGGRFRPRTESGEATSCVQGFHAV